jgi:hypothetical protein
VAVVYDPDFLDAIESVPPELDLDLLGVSIEGIPNQLDQARDRRRGPESLEMLLVKFNVEIHDGESRSKFGGLPYSAL